MDSRCFEDSTNNVKQSLDEYNIILQSTLSNLLRHIRPLFTRILRKTFTKLFQNNKFLLKFHKQKIIMLSERLIGFNKILNGI